MMTRISALALGCMLAGTAYAQTPATDAAPAPDAAAPAAAAPAAAGTGAAAQDAAISGTYQFDPNHSQVVFSWDHMGFTDVHGFVNGVTGTIVLDEADPSKSTVEASFPLSAIRTSSEKLDGELITEFFKGKPEDTVTFKSASVVKEDDDEAKVTGDLTMNGVTKPIILDVELNKFAPNPMNQTPTVGFKIDGEFKRSDFGLGMMVPAVSDEIEIDITVEAVKQ